LAIGIALTNLYGNGYVLDLDHDLDLSLEHNVTLLKCCRTCPRLTFWAQLTHLYGSTCYRPSTRWDYSWSGNRKQNLYKHVETVFLKL
jgi:hypothetical protein